MKRRHEDAELKASNDTVLEGMDWYFWVARGLIELSQTTKNKVVNVLLGFFGWADICKMTGFPWCQEMSGKMSKFYVFALFLLQWDMISRITKKKSWQNVNFTKDCGPKLYLQQRKRSTIRNTFLGFLPPLTTSCEDFQQTETIMSQLKNTLGHLRLWQSIARRWTRRLRLFERHMIGEEIELSRYAQRNGYYHPLLKAPLSRWFFLFYLVGYVTVFLQGMCKVLSMRGMVIPLILCVMEDYSRDFFQRNWNATQMANGYSK